MLNHGYPIAVAARRTGLSLHTIRAWEKRYAAIVPTRSATKRRLYSAEDIERLILLRQATQSGHSIGSIATLPNDALVLLAAEEGKIEPSPQESTPPSALFSAAWDAILALDSATLERLLNSGAVSFGRGALMQKVIVPLIEKVGMEWETGVLRVAQEHLATHVIRTFLSSFVQAHSETAAAPILLVATPPGQQHELGALIAGSVATDNGWKTVYLGASLPPEEIAAAAEQTNATALALSIVYPADDRNLAAQLKLIRRLLPDLPILVGGRSAHAYLAELESISAIMCYDMPGIVSALEKVRTKRAR